jgi:hypothetical protein
LRKIAEAVALHSFILAIDYSCVHIRARLNVYDYM